MVTNTIESASYRRNGSFGEGYYVVNFKLGRGRLRQSMKAIVFETSGCVAVLGAEGESWRCEDFEDQLRAWIASPEGEAMIWPGLVARHTGPRLVADQGVQL